MYTRISTNSSLEKQHKPPSTKPSGLYIVYNKAACSFGVECETKVARLPQYYSFTQTQYPLIPIASSSHSECESVLYKKVLLIFSRLFQYLHIDFFHVILYVPRISSFGFAIPVFIFLNVRRMLHLNNCGIELWLIRERCIGAGSRLAYWRDGRTQHSPKDFYIHNVNINATISNIH